MLNLMQLALRMRGSWLAHHSPVQGKDSDHHQSLLCLCLTQLLKGHLLLTPAMDPTWLHSFIWHSVWVPAVCQTLCLAEISWLLKHGSHHSNSTSVASTHHSMEMSTYVSQPVSQEVSACKAGVEFQEAFSIALPLASHQFTKLGYSRAWISFFFFFFFKDFIYLFMCERERERKREREAETQAKKQAPCR